jgi:hypothetical protein
MPRLPAPRMWNQSGRLAAIVFFACGAVSAAEFVVAPAEGLPLPVVSAEPGKPVQVLPAPAGDVPRDDPRWRDHLASKAAAEAWAEGVRESKHADKLAGYLGKICGREPALVKAADPLPEAAIVVGAACPDAIRAEAAKLGSDGWLVRTAGQRLFICGGGRQGTLYGIYAFLEDVLGCRWWAHDVEFVPRMPRITTPPLDIRVTPPFLLHDLYSREAQTGSGDMEWKARSKSTFQPTGSHTFHGLLAAAAANRPDYWPLVETKDPKTGAVSMARAVAKDAGDFNGRVLHFNYLAPGMADDLAAVLGREVLRRDGDVTDWVYMAGQGDWYGGLDQSPESKAVYEEESWTDADGQRHGGSSGPLLRLMNQTAGLVAKAHPGAQVGTLAYMSTDSPPGKTRPADNVWIWLPRLRYGITLSIEEAAAATGAAVEKVAAGSRRIKRAIERWAEITPGRLLIWEYGVNYTNYLRPTPNLRAIAENIRWYHRIGVRGIMVQGNYTSTGGDLVLLKNYVWRKLLWNPTLEVEPLVREFCTGYYGPAGDDVLAYVTALEDSVRGPEPIIVDEFDTQARYLTPELVAALGAALARAREKVAGPGQEMFLARVEEVAASVEGGRLWKEGELVERDGRLVRADLGGADTQARAETLARSARGSGVTEWACGVTQTRWLVAYNGGPLHALAAAGVTAKVAPRQGDLRLWSLARAGEVFVKTSGIAPGSEFFDVVGQPAADRIELVGETGYANWDSTPDHLQRDEIAIEPDGLLRWTATLERTSTGEGATATARITTCYPAAKPEDVTVEYDAGAGWKPLTIGPPRPHARPLLAEEIPNKPGQPSVVEVPPQSPFRLRVVRGGSAAVIDTVVFPKVVAVGAAWLPKIQAVGTFVWGEPVTGMKIGATVPLCERTIAIEAAAGR